MEHMSHSDVLQDPVQLLVHLHLVKDGLEIRLRDVRKSISQDQASWNFLTWLTHNDYRRINDYATVWNLK